MKIISNGVDHSGAYTDPSEISANTVYTITMWFYVPRTFQGSRPRLRAFNGNSFTTQLAMSDKVEEYDHWVKRTLTVTPTVSGLRVATHSYGNSYPGDWYCIDAIQVEQRDFATSYCDGSLGPGYSWASAYTPHETGSLRQETRLVIPDPQDTLGILGDRTTIIIFQVPFPSSALWVSDSVIFWYGDYTSPSTTDQYAMYWGSTAGDVVLRLRRNDGRGVRVWGYNLSFQENDIIVAAATVTDSLMSFYWNGSLVGTANDPPIPISTEYSTWGVGNKPSGSGASGIRIKRVICLDRALSADEIASITDKVLGHSRSLDIVSEAAQPLVIGDALTDRGIVATLAVDGDELWRSRDGDVHFWRIYDDTATTTINVISDAEVYPDIYITPKRVKTSGYTYRRWVPITWRADSSATRYPVMLGPLDTATLVTAGKMQSDGDDLRVQVDGSEVDRWLSGMNTASTKIWVNFDWQPSQLATLAAGIGASDTVETLDVNEDISGFPSSGILLIGSEAFVYTSKNDSLKRFLGVSRAAKGTTAAAHSAGDTVWWIQHDVWLLYGNSSASAPSVNDNYKPAFRLDTSTNTSWDYDDFGEDDGLRAAQWDRGAGSGTYHYYGGDHDASADPWQELGISVNRNAYASIKLNNPVGITYVSFANGEKYKETSSTTGVLRIQGYEGTGWTSTLYTIPLPTTAATWETWSWSGSTSSPNPIAIRLYATCDYGGPLKVECSDVTVTLDSSNTPTVTVNSEQGNYTLNCTISNDTTGESISITFAMDPDETLRINTDTKEVTYLADDSQQYQALTVEGDTRRDWLRLVPGENELSFSDPGTTEVWIDILWDRRYYE